MTSRSRRQLYVLAALLVVLAVLGVMSLSDGPAVPGGEPSNAAGGPAAAQPPPVADVKIEALKTDREGPSDPRRNLFVFAPKAAPPPPPQREPQPVPNGPGSPAAPVTPQGPPPIPLKFIGIMEGPGGKGPVAILSDGRGGTFYGREGDTIDGRYRVLKIGTESAELAYVDGRGRQTLRLSGQ